MIQSGTRVRPTTQRGDSVLDSSQPTGDPDVLKGALAGVFGSIDESLLRAIQEKLETIDVSGGQALFREGDEGDSLYVLLRGRLNVTQRDPETGIETLLGETAPGEAVGEIGLLTGETRTASLWATRDSRLIRIGREAFDALAETHPELIRRLAAVVVERLRKRTTSQVFSPRVAIITVVPARDKNGAGEVRPLSSRCGFHSVARPREAPSPFAQLADGCHQAELGLRKGRPDPGIVNSYVLLPGPFAEREALHIRIDAEHRSSGS